MEEHKGRYTTEELLSFEETEKPKVEKEKVDPLTLIEPIDESSDTPINIINHYIECGDETNACRFFLEHRSEIDVNHVFEDDGDTIFCKAYFYRVHPLSVMIAEDERFNPMIGSEALQMPVLNMLVTAFTPTWIDEREEMYLEDVKQLIEIILNSGKANLNAIDANKQTILHLLASIHQLDWVAEKVLEDESVNVNALDNFDKSALDIAIEEENIPFIKLLLKREDLKISEEQRNKLNDLST